MNFLDSLIQQDINILQKTIAPKVKFKLGNETLELWVEKGENRNVVMMATYESDIRVNKDIDKETLKKVESGITGLEQDTQVTEAGVKKVADGLESADTGASEDDTDKPVNKVSRQQYPNHTKMIENAQAKGHSLKGLKKGSGTSEADKNRYNSQKEIRKLQGPPPKGFDYDEFPYASTKQGGVGAHVELVSSSENQAAGRDLGQFYRKYGLKENDEFDVQLV